MKILAIAVLIVATVATSAQAEPRQSTEHNHNYIIRRQQAGLVSGVPTLRRIRGSREIDIYRNSMMFEKDQLVASPSADRQARPAVGSLGLSSSGVRLPVQA